MRKQIIHHVTPGAAVRPGGCIFLTAALVASTTAVIAVALALAIPARAAAATENAVEEAQPGRTEEVEILRSKVNILAIAFPDDEPVFALPAHNVAPVASSAAVAGAPQVVLKIRRRKFNQQQFRAGEIVVTRRLFRSGDSEYEA